MRQQLYFCHGTLQWGPAHAEEAENWRVCGFNSASSLSLSLFLSLSLTPLSPPLSRFFGSGSPMYKMYLHVINVYIYIYILCICIYIYIYTFIYIRIYTRAMYWYAILYMYQELSGHIMFYHIIIILCWEVFCNSILNCWSGDIMGHLIGPGTFALLFICGRHNFQRLSVGNVQGVVTRKKHKQLSSGCNRLFVSTHSKQEK